MFASTKSYKEFDNWCESPDAVNGEYLQTTSDQLLSQFYDLLRNSNNIKGAHITRDGTYKSTGTRIGRLTLGVRGIHLDFTKCVIDEIEIQAIDCSVTLIDCKIGSITSINNQESTLVFTNTMLGKVILGASSTNKLTISAGTVRQFYCPAPGNTPFTGGTVSIDDAVEIPFLSKQSPLFKTSQSFSSLRHHLEALENMPMAALMRSLELRAQRPNEPWLLRTINWFNWRVSDYGRRPEYAVLWLAGLFALTIAGLTYFHATATGFNVCGLPFTHTIQNLPATTAGDEPTAHLRRAIVLTLQALNPFSLFDSRRLIFPSNEKATAWLLFHGLLSDALLAVIAFAVRRRFRFSS
jgi:hypothetical protein